jgi:hypothetical protein
MIVIIVYNMKFIFFTHEKLFLQSRSHTFIKKCQKPSSSTAAIKSTATHN